MNCPKCQRAMSPQEQHTYKIMCENCQVQVWCNIGLAKRPSQSSRINPPRKGKEPPR